MRTIEIRRHSYTKKGRARGRGSHLSAEGVALAREIGSQIGHFDLVLTSQSPRTLETAVAMGFAVAEQLEALRDIPQEVIEEIGHHERWTWQYPFLTFVRFVDRGGPTARMGMRQEEAWMTALESAPANGSVLVISHGRVIESGLVTCIPDGDFASWGAPFRHCEGVKMNYVEGRFTDVTAPGNAHYFPRLHEGETLMDYICRGVLAVYDMERARLGSHSAVAHRLGMHRNTLYDWLEWARQHVTK